jgi:hypothetical protein
MSGGRDLSAISPAMRLTSASNHLSLLVSIVVIASPTAPSFIDLTNFGRGSSQM